MYAALGLTLRIALCWLQTGILFCWTLSSEGASPLLRMLSLVTACGVFAWSLRMVYLLRRTLLWRRRRSIRPSREIQAERRRIAADLHDGIGGQLVQAQAMLAGTVPDDVQVELARKAVEHSLLDLRLIVDSMDASDDPLSLRLARLRHRFQPVLAQRHIALQWQVPEAGHDTQMPRGALAADIAAIVQEALSNALQHSGARVVSLHWEYLGQSPHWRLVVKDDGTGLSAPRPEVVYGLGLAGMRRRAAAAGIKLQVQPVAEGGAAIRLEW